MSKENKFNKFKSSYEAFKSTNPRELFTISPNTFSDHEGLNFDEAKSGLEYILNTLDEAFETDSINSLSFNAYNALDSVLQSLTSSAAQFRVTRDQNYFQQFALQIDSMVYHIKIFGLSELVMGGAQLEKTSIALRAELSSLVTARAEAEKIASEIKTLIAPAIAGSLSESFTSRKNALYKGRKIWAIMLLIISCLCIYLTYDFVSKMTELISPSKDLILNTAVDLSENNIKKSSAGDISENNIKKSSAGDIKENKNSINELNNNTLLIMIVMRTIVLIPAYVFFAFAFGQYRKERDFEEEYAHKAAVATSLPNYGDLTREPSVRDQIVTGATNVIFSSPTNKNKENNNEEKVFGNIKELLESITKLVHHKE